MQLYGSFEERGYKFESYRPTTDSDPVAFEVRIFVGEELKHTLLVPMIYVPTFGVDIGDIQTLESVADRILKLLPEPRDFSEEAISALDKLEIEVGGKLVTRKPLNASQDSGAFAYTADMFTATFAEIFGGREAIDQWMKTKQLELGDRTPEEALRIGMVREVLTCVGEIAKQTLRF